MDSVEAAVRAAASESFLAGIDEAIVSRILRSARLCEIPSGRIFIDRSRRQRCGFVLSGLVRVYAVRQNGAQVTLRRVRRGGCIGIRALTGAANVLSVQALTDIEFIEIDPAVLHHEAVADADLAWAVAQEVSDRLMDTEQHITEMSGDSVAQRVAVALIDMVGDELPSSLSISQEHLAEVVGASREHVGHVIRRLATEGVLRLSRRRVEVIDAARLGTMLDLTPSGPR